MFFQSYSEKSASLNGDNNHLKNPDFRRIFHSPRSKDAQGTEDSH
jgi:hypothetical protein